MKFYCDLNRLRENRTNIKELEKKRFFALKIPWGLAPCRFDSDRRHQFFQLVRDPRGPYFFELKSPSELCLNFLEFFVPPIRGLISA